MHPNIPRLSATISHSLTHEILVKRLPGTMHCARSWRGDAATLECDVGEDWTLTLAPSEEEDVKNGEAASRQMPDLQPVSPSSSG